LTQEDCWHLQALDHLHDIIILQAHDDTLPAPAFEPRRCVV
jgi:hypothetical protein